LVIKSKGKKIDFPTKKKKSQLLAPHYHF